MQIKDKTVWITGASSGIGEACAIAFAKKGASLILSARNEKKLQDVKSKCIGASEIHVLQMDVSDHDKISNKVEEAISKTGQIDILVNNAGISQRSSVADSSLAIDKKIFDINFFGNVGITRALLPHMTKRKTGAILVTSSIAGKLGPPLRCAYSASKHALHGWYDVLRAEVASDGIQVNVVCPGYIKTDISINAVVGDGSKHGVMDKGQANGVSVEKCAKHFVKAVEKNKKESFIGGDEVQLVQVRNLEPAKYYNLLEKMASKYKKS